MTTPQTEPRVTRACAIFSVTDSFVILRGVDGPGAARRVLGPIGFQLTAIGSGAARQTLAAGWTLPVVQGISGAFISYGIIADPSGQQARPAGPPLTVDVAVTGPAYRATSLAGLQLVNLDPTQPTALVAAVQVQLAPGYGYPFPASPVGYSLVRGEVLASAGGAGVAQAQVTGTTAAGTWSDTYMTDGTGQWVFAIPDAAAGQITVTARDLAGQTDSAPVTVTASTTVAAPVLIPH
jgi:hypothetical protein